MYFACQSKESFDNHVSANQDKQGRMTKEQTEPPQIEAPEPGHMGDFDMKNDEDDTIAFKIKDFKEKAKMFAEKNYDKFAAQKGGKRKQN